MSHCHLLCFASNAYSRCWLFDNTMLERIVICVVVFRFFLGQFDCVGVQPYDATAIISNQIKKHIPDFIDATDSICYEILTLCRYRSQIQYLTDLLSAFSMRLENRIGKKAVKSMAMCTLYCTCPKHLKLINEQRCSEMA